MIQSTFPSLSQSEAHAERVTPRRQITLYHFNAPNANPGARNLQKCHYFQHFYPYTRHVLQYAALCVYFGLKYANIGEITVLFGIVKTIAHDILVGYYKAEIVGLKLHLTFVGFIQ